MSVAILLLAIAQLTGTSTTFEARLDVSHLHAADNLTDRTVSFTELRTLLDAQSLLGLENLELHVDARGRRAWSAAIASDVDVTRAYLRYGNSFARLAVGRMTILPVAGARVDGGELSIIPTQKLVFSAFGGLSPHPYTGAIDRRFIIGGGGYEWKSDNLNHAGGAALQLFDGRLDRAYLTERAYFVLSPEWMIYGTGIFDFSPRPDLSNGHVAVRWRPSRAFDVSISATHFHALVPNRWWQDWIREEREKRGFIVDGEEQPIGSRRSGFRVVTNFRPTGAVTPYAVARYDRRHDSPADGYEAQLGVKIDGGELGFLDANVTERRHFEADARLASITLGVELAEAISLDAQGTVMRTKMHSAAEELMLYDVGAGLWFDFRAITPELEGLRFLGQYQAFIDAELTYHVLFARMSYAVD